MCMGRRMKIKQVPVSCCQGMNAAGPLPWNRPGGGGFCDALPVKPALQKGLRKYGTHIAIYLLKAGSTRTPLHENSPNQVTNSETSPGPPPATAVHPGRGPCPGRKNTVNFPASFILPDCRYPSLQQSRNILNLLL